MHVLQESSSIRGNGLQTQLARTQHQVERHFDTNYNSDNVF